MQPSGLKARGFSLLPARRPRTIPGPDLPSCAGVSAQARTSGTRTCQSSDYPHWLLLPPSNHREGSDHAPCCHVPQFQHAYAGDPDCDCCLDFQGSSNDSRAAHDRVSELERQIEAQEVEIDLFKSDWSLLTSPARLEKLVERYGDTA